MVLFEACVDSVPSGVAAQQGGAARVELCANLVDGGTTPSIGTLRVLHAKLDGTSTKIHVLLRPRGGDFVYSDDEMAVMLADIDAIKQSGCADGIVLGALLPDGSVDELRVAQLVERSRPLAVTFHRAIDVCADAAAALRACDSMGIERVLTSGCAPSAYQGRAVLRQLVQIVAAEGLRVRLIAAAGVTEQNVARLVAETGVTEVHASGRRTRPGRTCFRPVAPIFMGAEKRNVEGSTEFELREVCAQRVRAYVAAIADDSIAAAAAGIGGSTGGGGGRSSSSSSGGGGGGGGGGASAPPVPPVAGRQGATLPPPKLFTTKHRTAPETPSPCPFGTETDPFPKPNEAIMGSQGGRRRDQKGQHCTQSTFVFG